MARKAQICLQKKNSVGFGFRLNSQSETERGPEHSLVRNQHTRELISARKSSHKHNNKDLSQRTRELISARKSSHKHNKDLSRLP